MDKLLNRVNDLLTKAEEVRATEKFGPYGSDGVDTGKLRGFRAASLSFIESLYSTSHVYYTDFNTSVHRSTYISHLNTGVEILSSIKHEIENGYLSSLKGIISAEIFTDFIEMAEHLLQEGYKDPAAVIIGSVLEQHIKQLCIANDIDVENEKDGKIIPLKADRLNAELYKSNICSKTDQKSVTTWLDIRNNAAHGNYKEYTTDQINIMLMGVTDFISRNPVE